MKVIFLGGFFNHYMKAISDALYQELGDNYSFLSTYAVSEKRKNLGWKELEAPYLINAHTKEKQAKYIPLLEEADIVIDGEYMPSMITPRLKKGKITLQHSERLLKKDDSFFEVFPRRVKYHRVFHNQPNEYLLCTSAFATSDYNRIGLFEDRCYQWGYFPSVESMDVEEVLLKKKKHSLIWVARMLDWKHPELVVELGKKLKEEGYDFTITMIGTGDLLESIQKMVEEYELSDVITILGSMTPEEVRAHMKESEIYLFTSNRHEGWGVVLNEAMNSACACVANDQAGATPYLIHHQQNGLIYQSGSFESLYQQVKTLLDSDHLSHDYGRKAYESIETIWNPEVASKRLVQLCKDLLEKGSSTTYQEGPCAKARVMKEDWFMNE